MGSAGIAKNEFRGAASFRQPELTELGRVACASLERGEQVPLIASLELDPDVVAALRTASTKVARETRRVGSKIKSAKGNDAAGDSNGSNGWGRGQRLGKGRHQRSRWGHRSSRGQKLQQLPEMPMPLCGPGGRLHRHPATPLSTM